MLKFCLPWPYAVSPVIRHRWVPSVIQIWLIFEPRMQQSVKPADNLWTIVVDGVDKAVNLSAWVDQHTLTLAVINIAYRPSFVQVTYTGPDPNLRTNYDKQWEPFAEFPSEEIDPNQETLTVSTGPAIQNDVDTSAIAVIFLDCSANAITIGGFVNGVNGQTLQIARLCAAANNATLQHQAGSSVQDVNLHAGANETLTGEFGGWTLVCDGSKWYDVSHAKHV